MFLIFTRQSSSINYLFDFNDNFWGYHPADFSSHRVLLGLWQMVASPIEGTLEIAELRDSANHLNVLFFLEPPLLVNLTLESKPVFADGKLDVDIGLRHPFLGMTQFTGFDVCGALITNGSMSGFEDPDIVIAGPGDIRA